MSTLQGTLDVTGFIWDAIDHRPRPRDVGLQHGSIATRMETLVRRCGAHVVTGTMSPWYDRERDLIGIPSRAQFVIGCVIRRPRTYAFTLAHELAHWTGHRRRLARNLAFKERFDAIYNREEQVAELAAALLIHDLGIDRPLLMQARYLDSYLASFADPRVELSLALAHANRAVGFVMTLARGRSG